MRITAVVPALAALLLASACGPTSTINNQGGPDAAIVRAPDGKIITPDGSTTGTDGHVTSADASTVACSPKGTAAAGKQHNSGTDCMGCHGSEFSVAGTLYSAASGGSKVVGGVITITDASGVKQTAASGTSGNFWLRTTVNFPVTISASLCPSVQVMVSQAQDGSCNQGGCHDGSASPGRVHL
jgi:hypothetical protein